MNTKIKLLSVALAVIGCVVVLSDSAASIQQIMGILIAMLILHFYLTRHFDDVIDLSKDLVQKKTEQFRIDKQIEKEAPRQDALQDPEHCFQTADVNDADGAALLSGVLASAQNQQTDPYRLTLDQRPWILSQRPLNCEDVAAYSHSPAPPGGHYEHVYDLKSLEQGLARKPANSIAAQQKMIRNKQFFDHYWRNQLDQEEARIWYEDAFVCQQNNIPGL